MKLKIKDYPGPRMHRFLILFYVILLCILFSSPAHAAATEAGPMKFKTFSYIDKQGIGLEAFSLLIPEGWKFEGGIRWVLDNPGMPAVAAFKVRNPSGREEFEAFPTQVFFWTNNQMLLSTFPVGAKYFGSEVRPPVAPLDALKGILVPRFRGDAANLRIVQEQELPELAKALGAGMQSAPGVTSSASAGKIRIEYQKGGVMMEEEMYGVVEEVHFSIPSMYGTVVNTNWLVEYLFSFKAEKGGLDKKAKLFQTIAYSFRLNPQWFNKYNQFVEYLVQMQIKRINNIGEISRIISRTSNEISDMMRQSYEYRQSVSEKIADNFSQYVRGVDKYHDPVDNKAVELPSGYNNAWTNGLGEYIVSDSPDYNPNIGSTKNWQKMERK